MTDIPSRSFLHRLTTSAQKRRNELIIRQHEINNITVKAIVTTCNEGKSSCENPSEGCSDHSHDGPATEINRLSPKAEGGEGFHEDNDDSIATATAISLKKENQNPSALHESTLRNSNGPSEKCIGKVDLLLLSVPSTPIKDVSRTPILEWTSFHYGRAETLASSSVKGLTGLFSTKDGSEADISAPVLAQTEQETKKSANNIAAEKNEANSTSSLLTLSPSPTPIGTADGDKNQSFTMPSQQFSSDDKRDSDPSEEERRAIDVLPISTDKKKIDKINEPTRRPTLASLRLFTEVSNTPDLQFQYISPTDSKSPASSHHPTNSHERVFYSSSSRASSTSIEYNGIRLVVDRSDSRDTGAHKSYNHKKPDQSLAGISTFAEAWETRQIPSPIPAIAVGRFIPDFKNYREIPLLDYHDMVEIEIAAAKASLREVSVEKPGEEQDNSKKSQTADELGTALQMQDRDNLWEFLKQSNFIPLEDCTALKHRRTLEELFEKNSNWAAYELRTHDDLKHLLIVEAEADYNKQGGGGNKKSRNIGVRNLINKVDVDHFMRKIHEQECIRTLHQMESKYMNYEEVAAEKAYKINIQKKRATKGIPGTFKRFGQPDAYGWVPVHDGWMSENGRLICVKSGMIPRFDYYGPHWEEQNEDAAQMGPMPPKIVWSGVKDYDDVHINQDIAIKMFGLDDEWKKTAAGMYHHNTTAGEYDSEDDEDPEVTWGNKRLNHRLMMTCNSVHGSNVSLRFDPEELDIPTLDGERNFCKMNQTLLHEYPDYVKPFRTFGELGEVVVIPPPVRKSKIPRKPCLKSPAASASHSWRLGRRNNRFRNDKNVPPPKNIKKTVRWSLTAEQELLVETFHPRMRDYCKVKMNMIRDECRNGLGLFDMLPSVRAKFTRVKGYERYYPSFLQPPPNSQLKTTLNHPAAYFLNHISRFKLGIPASSKQKTSVDKAVNSTLKHKQSFDDSKKTQDFFSFKLFVMGNGGRPIFGRTRQPVEKQREGGISRDDGVGDVMAKEYLVYLERAKSYRKKILADAETSENANFDYKSSLC